jgi:hypothetical protein
MDVLSNLRNLWQNHSWRVTDAYSQYLGLKRTGREAHHSTPTSAEDKKTWIYTSTPQYVFMARCLIKYKDNFTFTLSP